MWPLYKALLVQTECLRQWVNDVAFIQGIIISELYAKSPRNSHRMVTKLFMKFTKILGFQPRKKNQGKFPHLNGGQRRGSSVRKPGIEYPIGVSGNSESQRSCSASSKLIPKSGCSDYLDIWIYWHICYKHLDIHKYSSFIPNKNFMAKDVSAWKK